MSNRLAIRAALPLYQFDYEPPFDPDFFGRLQPALHDYQMEILLQVVAAIQFGYTRILVQLATGGGKTHLAKALLGSADRAQFIVHRKELIEQTSRTFLGGAIEHGFVAAGREMDPEARVLLCGVASLAKRLGVVLPPSLAIWDEAHHCTAATWAETMAAYPPDTVHIGLTATPERLDGRGLGEFFQTMICGPSVAELIRRGFLSPYEYYAPSLPDFTGVSTDEAAAKIMDDSALIGDMVAHYQRLAPGKPGIIFASNLGHSRHLVEAFRGAGIRAAHIDGEMRTSEREAIDKAFRNRELDLLSNVNLLGEGYDVPGIEYCALGRRTKSLSLLKQWWGRALRTSHGKDLAIISDHAGNAFFHGMMPDDDYEWTLEGRSSRASGCVSDDADPIRQCLQCFRVYLSRMNTCPGCGADATSTPREIRMREGELAKLEKEALKARLAAEKQAITEARKAEEKACKDYADFFDLATRRGYQNPHGWACMRGALRDRYASRFGH